MSPADDEDQALHHRCGLCGAPPGKPCRNTIRPGEALPGRAAHFYRLTKPTSGEQS